MIIIHCDRVKNITQKIYNQMINKLDLVLLTCPLCSHTGTEVHSYYDRAVKSENITFRLVVLRIRCQFCGHTHAILPDTIVPYSSVSLKDTISILLSETPDQIKSFLLNNLSLDFSDVYRIRRNFKKYWEQRLKSTELSIDNQISQPCISAFRRQFMQIHCGLCRSYTLST